MTDAGLDAGQGRAREVEHQGTQSAQAQSADSHQSAEQRPAAQHSVEGTASQLAVHVFDAGHPAPGLPPVLLLHGFASSTALNWVQAGWITALDNAGRNVIAIDLPGMGDSPAPADPAEFAPSRIRAEILQVLMDQGVQPLSEQPGTGVDVLGYSLGSRLAWELAATQPEFVRRVVLGGSSAGDPLAEADADAALRYLQDGTEIADARTAEFMRMAALVPDVDAAALVTLMRAIQSEPFTPEAEVPRQPCLLVSGEKDDVATRPGELVSLLEAAGGSPQLLTLPARSHNNAVTARAFKEASTAFLAE